MVTTMLLKTSSNLGRRSLSRMIYPALGSSCLLDAYVKSPSSGHHHHHHLHHHPYYPNHQQRCHFHSVFGKKKKKNYYEILGVGRDANKKTIKKNYIKLAKIYHPDSSAERTKSQSKFQEVLEAYQVLSDDGKRKAYDEESMKDMGAKYEERTQNINYRRHHATVDAKSLFREIFGDLEENPFQKDELPKEERYAETIWGHDVSESLIIPLTMEEAANGCEKEIPLKTVDLCYLCNGTRSAFGYRASQCPFCDESGMETVSTEPIICKIKCRACNGTREYIKYLCPDCEGKGYQVQEKMAIFNIPPGVHEEEKLKLVIRNQVIWLTCRIKASDYFRKVGYDVHTVNEISLSQAILGGKTKIRGLYGEQTVPIPSGTQSHSSVKLDNQGWRLLDNSYGYHIVHFKIKVPEKLSRKQRKIWEEFAELEDGGSGTVDGLMETPQGKKYVTAAENESFLVKLKRAIIG